MTAKATALGLYRTSVSVIQHLVVDLLNFGVSGYDLGNVNPIFEGCPGLPDPGSALRNMPNG
ncbi:hypothetical protein HGRIS_014731 [Hohenbuehelia grisea]|uniref:Uncharacterized protein n=1 Tax=Hohenbuehelia grisea TaxID=104357 RepID=A0ABR3IQH1_9AGAR